MPGQQHSQPTPSLLGQGCMPPALVDMCTGLVIKYTSPSLLWGDGDGWGVQQNKSSLFYNVGTGHRWKCSSVGVQSTAETGSTPQCSTEFFSQNQLSVQTLLQRLHSHPCACINISVHVQNTRHWQPYNR